MLLNRALGQVLCKFDDVTVVTGGGYNTEYLISHSFLEETRQSLKSHRVWHVLPERDRKVERLDRKVEIEKGRDREKEQ